MNPMLYATAGTICCASTTFLLLLFFFFLLRPPHISAGSIAAGYIAVQRGFAINLGGGFHHCCGYDGGGFCPFADITLRFSLTGALSRTFSLSLFFFSLIITPNFISYRHLRKQCPNIKKVLIVDLDGSFLRSLSFQFLRRPHCSASPSRQRP